MISILQNTAPPPAAAESVCIKQPTPGEYLSDFQSLGNKLDRCCKCPRHKFHRCKTRRPVPRIDFISTEKLVRVDNLFTIMWLNLDKREILPGSQNPYDYGVNLTLTIYLSVSMIS